MTNITSTEDSSQLSRCSWCHGNELYEHYHDEEWGVPCYDDAILFEFLLLESAQAGLSWLTILKKRENYRQAFANFDAVKVAAFTEQDVERLMANKGIVRNRLKIESAITNAQYFLAIQKEFGRFADYFWGFVDHTPIINRFEKMSELPATTELSDTISKDMKKRGFRFFGSTICYAHMQATGMMNDHLLSCHRYQACNASSI